MLGGTQNKDCDVVCAHNEDASGTLWLKGTAMWECTAQRGTDKLNAY